MNQQAQPRMLVLALGNPFVQTMVLDSLHCGVSKKIPESRALWT